MAAGSLDQFIESLLTVGQEMFQGQDVVLGVLLRVGLEAAGTERQLAAGQQADVGEILLVLGAERGVTVSLHK
jgi:hypothetical protein